MNNRAQFFLADGRECYPFPWDTPKSTRPWSDEYERVIIPFTPTEQMHARKGKTHHVQVVKRSKLRVVKQRFQPKRASH